MAEKLFLVRHALTDLRTDGLLLGPTDAPLSDIGERQAAALRGAMRRRNPDRCLCSPLQRARQTAELAGLPAEVDPDLREVDFGQWEGMTFAEVAASDPQGAERWAAFNLDFAFPGGDRLDDFLSRVSALAGRLAADPVQRIAVVTHGGVIRAMICHLLGLDRKSYVLFDVQPASLTTIDLFGSTGVLSGLSDVCHLEGL